MGLIILAALPSPVAAAGQTIEIPIFPGPNLVSFPAAPQDPDIDAVLGAASFIIEVTKPASAGQPAVTPTCAAPGVGCLSSERVGGVFVGDISSLGAEAFWVSSVAFGTLEVLLGATPSSFAAEPTFTLVPILNFDSDAAGTSLPADEAFTGTSWTVAFGFDTALNAFEKLDPETGATVEVGRGYFLAVPASAVLVPNGTPPPPVPGVTGQALGALAALLVGAFAVAVRRRRRAMIA